MVAPVACPDSIPISTEMANVILFGAQSTRFSREQLSHFRESIQEDAGLRFFRDVIKDLPTIWPVVVNACPSLAKVPAAGVLAGLHQVIQDGVLPPHIEAKNMLFVPLTVLSQLIEFWKMGQKTGSQIFSKLASRESKLSDVQGFCVGFLAASVVACSADVAEFQRLSTTVLNLAVCIGAAVDLDEASSSDPLDRFVSFAVRFRSKCEREQFEQTLSRYHEAYISCVTDKGSVTVTVRSRDANAFTQNVTTAGMSMQPISLSGRYHHPGHEEVVALLKNLCDADQRFQLPTTDCLRLPLRSNSDAQVITKGDLHSISLDSILLNQALWFQTVESVMNRFSSANTQVQMFTVGREAFIPSSLAGCTSRPGRTDNRPVQPEPIQSPQNALTPDVSPTTNGTCSHDTSMIPDSSVAIVGMACRYPDADSIEEFWNLIQSGGCAVRELPESRFRASDLWRGPKGTFWGNFLRHPDTFDHRFFGISGREAKSMDPQQRLLLEVTYEAMESSGYFSLGNRPQSRDIGCFVGVGSVDYADNISSHDPTAFSALGTLRAFITGRVSHFFGWTGPSITYDTACSSGAVAIHAACKAIQTKECSVAVAGGVNVITSPGLFQNLAAAKFLSPTGASKAFDANADGYCRGEGVGLMVLKPFSDAVANNDNILGIISGSAVNQGANCTPITVPDQSSQTSVYQKALSVSGTNALDVSYVEAHGTGTPVGDPIELNSIRQTFGGSSRDEDLFVGSVKDNIGHTETASGAAGLLKTVLMMQKKVIPKQANFSRLNPSISSLEPDKIQIAAQSKPWKSKSPTRTAVINNYGAAGSNTAIVLQSYDQRTGRGVDNHIPASGTKGLEYPFFISAHSLDALLSYCTVLKAALPTIQGGDGAPSIAYNLATKQNQGLEYTLAFTAQDTSALADKLTLSNDGEADIHKSFGGERPVILCFGGQSGTSVSLSEELFDNCVLLQTYLGECDSTCADLGLPGLFPYIFRNTPCDDLVRLHCMLFSLQYACARCWLDCGLNVSALIGHSFGQLTALCVAGSLSLADGLRLIGGRARVIQADWGPDAGAMLSVEGKWDAIQDLLRLVAEQCPSTAPEIACYNGPRNCVISGSTTSIEAFEKAALEGSFAEELKIKRLQNTHAYHSNLVDGIIPALTELCQTLEVKRPSIPIEACCSEGPLASFTAEEIVQHSRDPVYFNDAVQRIAKQHPSSAWVEAGSGSSIIPMVRRALKGSEEDCDFYYQSLDIGNSDAQRNLSKATCRLWNIGIRAQHWQFHRRQRHAYQWIDLPPYQFHKSPHWLEYKPPVSFIPAPSGSSSTKEAALLTLLEHKRQPQEALFSINCDHQSFKKCVEGHAVLGQSLCPASLYVELAISAAGILDNKCPSGTVPNIQRLEISSPLGSSPLDKLFLNFSKNDEQMGVWKFSLYTRKGQHEGESVTHASGAVAVFSPENDMTSSRLWSLNRLVGNSRCETVVQSPGASSVSGSVIYQIFGRVVNYADYYRGVRKVVAKDREATGTISLPETSMTIETKGFSDPLMVDNCLQVAGIHVNILSEHTETEVFVCTAVEEILFSPAYIQRSASQKQWTVYTVFDSRSKGDLVSDIFVLDPDSGKVVLAIISAQFKSLPIKILAKILSRLNGVAFDEPQTNGVIHHKQDGALVDESHRIPNGDSSSNTTVAPQSGSGDTISRLQVLLSEVIGIPPEEAQPNSSLIDLGVDSLMATEVIAEIQKHFEVELSASDLQQATTLMDLVRHIQPSASDPGASRDIPVRVAEESISPRHSAGQPNAIARIQAILSDIMDIPANEITPSTTLLDIGVDSLVATELLGEIKTHFNVEIQPGEFQGLFDIQSLCNCVQPSAPTAEPDLLSNGTAIHKPASSFAPVAFKQAAALKREFDTIARETRFIGFSQSVYPAQRELVAAYVVEAFTSLGCPLGSLAPGQPVPAISVSPVHQKVEKQLYKVLEDYDLIAQTAEGTLRTTTPVPTVCAESLHQNIVDRFSQHASEHLLLHTTGPKLAECLTAKVDPLSLLFRDKEARLLLEDVYANAPMFRTGTILLAQYLTNCLRNFGGSRVIKIIELGAGTGGTTKHLIDTLVKSEQPFHYTFTDISSSMVAAAKKKFSQYESMEFMVLDIEKTISMDLQGHYDIVISTNCIHATSDLGVSTTNIKNLLRQDGILCLVELTRNLFWFDLVFGLLEGWWLFKDGRQHALTHEKLWEQCLRRSGFQCVDWSESSLTESEILRVIVATPSIELPQQSPGIATSLEVDNFARQETVVFQKTDGIELLADIYYPDEISAESKPRPVALMIHGGGHIMLSRKDIRPEQTEVLLEKGFIPVSVDYRLCPEVTLEEGPIQDVCTALHWARATLPQLPLKRSDISITGESVVAVGWSTGGHLAMSLGWTAPSHGIQPPEAILAFYCPTDYEDPFWTRPNLPFGPKLVPEQSGYDLWEAVHDQPITGYNPPPAARALGGWMVPNDPRSRIALHMNWKAKTLPILLHGLQRSRREGPPEPSLSQIQAISPLSQISKGTYNTPTFIVHGTQDDLIPWEQAERTYQKLTEHGIDAEIRLVKDAVHLFDIYRGYEKNIEAAEAVRDGYRFLQKYVRNYG